MNIIASVAELLGPQDPYRVWIIAFIACVVACFHQGSRRAGSIGLLVFFAVAGISVLVRNAYISCTPAIHS